MDGVTIKFTMVFSLKRSRLTSLPDALVLLTYIRNVSTSILSWQSDNLGISFFVCLSPSKQLVG